MKTPPRSLLDLLMPSAAPVPTVKGRRVSKMEEADEQDATASIRNRQAARAAHERHYYREEPCPRCGAYRFYTSNGTCITCHREAARVSAANRKGIPKKKRIPSEARQLARDAGAPQFVREWPCPKCGDHAHYTVSGGCVACHREMSRISAKKSYRCRSRQRPKGKY